MAELGHSKDEQGKGIFNYPITYERNNREPLFYEDYPGKIVDILSFSTRLIKRENRDTDELDLSWIEDASAKKTSDSWMMTDMILSSCLRG